MSTNPQGKRVLRRSKSHRILGGVCGGLAEYFNTNPLLVRAIFVVVAIFAGSGLLIYLLLWLLVPQESAPGVVDDSTSGVDVIAQDLMETSDRLRGAR